MFFEGANDDFDPSLTQFCDFEQHPIKAVLLWYLNAGLDVSEWLHRLPNEFAESKLKEEIRSHVLSPKEKDKLVQKFHSARYGVTNGNCTQVQLLSCGACGQRQFQRGCCQYKQVCIDTIASLVELKGFSLARYRNLKEQSPIEIPIDPSFKLKEIQLEQLMGVYESRSNVLYALHPEFVFENADGQECTVLCPDCQKHFIDKGTVNPLSLAAGIDHGDTD